MSCSGIVRSARRHVRLSERVRLRSTLTVGHARHHEQPEERAACARRRPCARRPARSNRRPPAARSEHRPSRNTSAACRRAARTRDRSGSVASSTWLSVELPIRRCCASSKSRTPSKRSTRHAGSSCTMLRKNCSASFSCGVTLRIDLESEIETFARLRVGGSFADDARRCCCGQRAQRMLDPRERRELSSPVVAQELRRECHPNPPGSAGQP